MASADTKGAPYYVPSRHLEATHRVKKVAFLLGYLAFGAFTVWLVGPGLASAPSVDLDYLITIGAVGVAFVALGFLFVVTWHERLPRIENGLVSLPFPIRRTDGSRTARIQLSEIASVESTVNSIGRSGGETFLLDGTRLFLPTTVFGERGSEVINALVTYAKSQRTKESARERVPP